MFLFACLPRACFVSLNINLLLLMYIHVMLMLMLLEMQNWREPCGPEIFTLSFWDMPSKLAEHHEEYPFLENKNHNFVHQKQKLKNMNPPRNYRKLRCLVCHISYIYIYLTFLAFSTGKKLVDWG